MALDQKDAFRDLQFNGQPSGYRDFRRKVILSVAGLEDKHAYLAGPRLLSRLSGEAWRATEHLSVGSLRQSDGWLKAIRALDDHYKYLPETELHDAIEEFLFMLKRRPNEGATSFSSRFRTQLDRVQTLIAQERDATRKKRKRKHGKSSRPPSPDDEPSSLEETDRDIDPKEHDPQAEAERASSGEPQVFDPFAEEPRPASEKPESEARPPSMPGHAATDPVRSKPPSTLREVVRRSRRHQPEVPSRKIMLTVRKRCNKCWVLWKLDTQANTYFSTECAGTLVYEEVWIVARTASTDHQVHQRIFSIPGCGANHESI